MTCLTLFSVQIISSQVRITLIGPSVVISSEEGEPWRAWRVGLRTELHNLSTAEPWFCPALCRTHCWVVPAFLWCPPCFVFNETVRHVLHYLGCTLKLSHLPCGFASHVGRTPRTTTQTSYSSQNAVHLPHMYMDTQYTAIRWTLDEWNGGETLLFVGLGLAF